MGIYGMKHSLQTATAAVGDTAGNSGWGFSISEALLRQTRQIIAEMRDLECNEAPQWHRRVVDVASQLIFAGVAAYYEAPLERALPPLADGVAPDDALQTIGLGLTFWAGKVLQGRSVEELWDLSRYIEASLIEGDDGQPPQLVLPLDAPTARQIERHLERIKASRDDDGCRASVREAVIEIGVATVETYYREVGQSVQDVHHFQRVIEYSKREAQRSLEDILDQVLPTFPRDHLIHFAFYIESLMRRGVEPDHD